MVTAKGIKEGLAVGIVIVLLFLAACGPQEHGIDQQINGMQGVCGFDSTSQACSNARQTLHDNGYATHYNSLTKQWSVEQDPSITTTTTVGDLPEGH